jgi:glycosyltransferase involved in cell wall biosynthesis
MNQMKRIAVLVLNNFVNDNRVQKIASSLGQHQYDVTVVAFLKGAVEEKESHPNYKVHRIRLKSSGLPSGNKIFGAIKYLEFIFKTIRHYRSYDIIHCNDFEAMFIGVCVKCTRPKLQLVYDCHEYERERTAMNFVKKWSTRMLEPIVIRFARQVFVVSPGILSEYQRLYPSAKTDLLMNVPHIQEFDNQHLLRKAFGLRDDQRIYLYQGALTVGRGIEVLLDTFSNFQQDHRVVVFMGYGPLVEKIKSVAANHPCVYYHPAVAYSEIMNYTSGADFGLNTPQNVSKSYYYCLPNKLFEYIHAEIPIITNNLYDCRLLVEAEQIGTVISTFDREGITQAIVTAESLDRPRIIERMKTIKARYTWQEEEQKLLAYYAQIV